MYGHRTVWMLVCLAAGLFQGRGPAVRAESPRDLQPMVERSRRDEDTRQVPPLPVLRPSDLPLPAPGPPSLLEQPAAVGEMEPVGPQPLLSLGDFEAMACAEHPALAAAAAGIEVAHGRWQQAGLYPNTVIGYTGNEMGIRDTAGKQGMFINQRFITGGKLRLDRAVAGQQIEVARFDYEATRLRVLNDVRIRFSDLLIAQRRRQLTDRLAAIGEQSADATRNLLRGGQISRTQVLQAEIEAETAHILHENATGDHRAAWRRLGAVIGVPNMELMDVAGDLKEQIPERSWEQSLAMLLDLSPELGAAAVRVEQARLSVARARRERIPNVDLSVAVRHENVTTDDTTSVQVGFPLPLLDRNQGNIHRAEAELATACANLKRIELALHDRLAVAFRRYENARRQVRRYVDRILPRAQESLQWVREGYAEGQVDFLTLLTSQRTYFRVNLDYLESLRELRVAAVTLEGLLLTGSLGTAP